MEVGVLIIGVILRFLDFILAPWFWLRERNTARVPPITNALLLRSATDLAADIRNGKLKSEEIVTAYIDRAKEVDPYINAVVEDRYDAAIEDAKAVDQLIADAVKDGRLDELFKGKPLLGVPFTVKESCSLAGLSNAVGCLEFAGRRATQDGAVVRLVKEAGGIPLLVSNTPELCLGWETTNLLKGTTNNPHCLSLTAGGSSGGEGALLASGASPLSVASDIAGSIRLPAAFCGVFGHKPTPGVISIEGHIPTLTDENYSRLLTVGPMARCVDDLSLLTAIMAGDDARKLRLDEPVDMKQVTVLYMTEAGKSIALMGVRREVKDAVVQAAHYLRDHCGATLSEEKFKELEDSVEMSISVFFSMKDIPNLLQDPTNPKRDKSLAVELAKYVCGGGSRSLQGLGFVVLARSQLFIPRARRALLRAKAARLAARMRAALGAHGVLLYPAWASGAHAHGRVWMRAASVLYTMMLNVLGLPATLVPLPRPLPLSLPGHSSLPRAIQVIAAPHQDRLCLAVARQLEMAFGGWKPPN